MGIIPSVEYKKHTYQNDNKLMSDIKRETVKVMLEASLKRFIWEAPTFLWVVITGLLLAIIYSAFIK